MSQVGWSNLIASLPLALVISVMTTVVGGIYYASHMAATLADHEQRIARMEASGDLRWVSITDRLGQMAVDLAAMRATMTASQAAIERLQAADDRRAR